jgi:hypothetical protein
MAIATKITCDGCGTEKKETNHWLDVWVDAESGAAVHFTPISAPAGYRLFAKQVCGHACAHKLLDQWLTMGTIVEGDGGTR